MKTYLNVHFSSDGAKPSTVRQALADLGFIAMQGPHDFVYAWPGNATIEDVLAFADRIHAELEGMGVLFQLETV
jgi:hypothetical protein